MSDSLQQQVLDTIQSGFPLDGDPYRVLAEQLGTDAGQIREAVDALYSNGSIRRIGASFDSRKLGYSSTLCALAVPGGEEELAQAAGVVSSFAGVTHNYGRVNRYNLWFTLITRSAEDKRAVLASIRERTGCLDLLDMPATRKYKISVDFGRQRAAASGLAADRGKGEGLEASGSPPFDPSNPFDVGLVRWAQGDIARNRNRCILPDPYMAAAQHPAFSGGGDKVSPDRVLARLRELKAAGVVRRFGAMVRHQNIGFSFNAMTVWDIPDEVVDEAGATFAQAPFVSHCYTRPRSDTWHANLYAMVHAQSPSELEGHFERLASMLSDAGIACRSRLALETTHEFKKVSMRYFEEADAC